MDITGAFDAIDPIDGVDFIEDDIADIDFKTGIDLDMIAGYDFGAFRLEAELGYKRARADEVEFDQSFVDFAELLGEDVDDFDVSSKVSVLSLMGNALADFGSDDGVSGYIGAGFGRARLKAFGERDSKWAWQIIAGVRTAMSENIDVGLKYRYFRTGRISGGETLDLVNDAGAPVG